MFYTDTQTVVARKRHRCTNCGQSIEPGETYKRWTTFDGSAFVNKMHPECLASLQDDADAFGEFEYMPYSGERPGHSSAGTGDRS